jgi:Uma2 family endonuclease
MSVTEFLDWVPQDDCYKWQLVDGVPIAMSPANALHTLLQAQLATLISVHLRTTGRNCDVFVNPGVIPATMSAHNMRIPDIVVNCTRIKLGQIAPPNPVVLIEILSPSNSGQTWANVWAYTSIPTAREILILRGDAMGGDILRRLPDGSWPDETSVVADQLSLESIGFRVTFSELYERTPLLDN